MTDKYEILKVIAYQFYNQKLVEELINIKNKDYQDRIGATDI